MSSSNQALPILSFGSIPPPDSTQLPQFPTVVLPNPDQPLPQLPALSNTTPRSSKSKKGDSSSSLNNSNQQTSSLPDLKHLARSVLNAKKIAIVCGAGISTASGIPDFRSSSGLFESLKKQYPDAKLSSGKDLFDVGLFASEQNAGIFYNMIAELRKQTDEVEPTKFHEWLKELDDMGKLFRVYTQNIDSLEERAGLSYGLGNTSLPLPPRYGPRSPTKPKAKKDLKPTTSSVSSTAASPFSLPNSSQASTVSSLSLRRSDSASSLSSLSSLSSYSSTTSTPPPPTHSSIPRCIPLHGHLSTLSCALCSNTFPLHPFLPLLSSGQPPLCPTCHTIDQERSSLGRRSRGVGVLKPDVVLYGERHKDGDRIGEITQRDLMGVRPDLLIVVGTTLKVPGTKKLVKELSKVIKPPLKEGGKGKGKVSTIFLNKEFPGGGKEWLGIFDVWCRGDIQEFVEEIKKEKVRMEEEKITKEEKKKPQGQTSKPTSKIPNSKPPARPRARPSALRPLSQPTLASHLSPPVSPAPPKPSFFIEVPSSISNPLKRRRSSPLSTTSSASQATSSTSSSSTRTRRTSTLLSTNQSLITANTTKARSNPQSVALGFKVTKKNVGSVTGTKDKVKEKVEVSEGRTTRSSRR